MRNALPPKPNKNECAIVNLDDKNGPGTHWVAFKKIGTNIQYYDSFGQLRPPLELINYFGKTVKVTYNYNREQNFDSYICGHLCLKFLTNNLY